MTSRDLTCPKCQKKVSRMGYRGCYPCEAKYKREWRAKNPERLAVYAARKKAKRDAKKDETT